MRYHVRHGAHQDNVLTARGIAEVSTSAQELAARLKATGILAVVLICSPIWRAIASAAIVGAVLEKAGVKVTFAGAKAELTVAKNTAGLMKALGVTYGKGLIEAWRNATDESRPPDTESYAEVSERVLEVFEVVEADFFATVVGVYHGGAIEPATRLEIDLPSGALVIETDNAPPEIFDPANASPQPPA